MSKRTTGLVCCLVAGGLSASAWAGAVITDPTATVVNPLDRSIQATTDPATNEQFGNTELNDFNLLNIRVFNFEGTISPNDQVRDGSRGTFSLTQAVSGIDATVSAYSGTINGSYSFIVDAGADYVTSGTQSIVTNYDDFTFDVTSPDGITGFGMTVNRFFGNAPGTITIYGLDDTTVLDTLTIPNSPEIRYLFVGYVATGDNAIGRIEMLMPDTTVNNGNQWAIDDFAIVIPEPGSLLLMLAGGAMLLRRRK